MPDTCNRDCPGWLRSYPQIARAQTMEWIHGGRYTGDVFVYCPWCGKELAKMEDSEAPDANGKA